MVYILSVLFTFNVSRKCYIYTIGKRCIKKGVKNVSRLFRIVCAQIVLFVLGYELHQTTGKSASAGLKIALNGNIRKCGTIYAHLCVHIYNNNNDIHVNSIIKKYFYIIFANLLIINYLSLFYTVKICIFIWKMVKKIRFIAKYFGLLQIVRIFAMC